MFRGVNLLDTPFRANQGCRISTKGSDLAAEIEIRDATYDQMDSKGYW